MHVWYSTVFVKCVYSVYGHIINLLLLQKVLQLEEVNESELRDLQESVSQLTQENKNYESKFKGQKEQSE